MSGYFSSKNKFILRLRELFFTFLLSIILPVIFISAAESSLERAFLAALSNNLGLKAEKESISQNMIDYGSVLDAFLPNVTASYTRHESYGPSWIDNLEYGTANISVNYTIPLGFSHLSEARAASENIAALHFSYEFAEQRLLSGVADAYMDVVSARRTLALAKNNAMVMGKHVDAVTKSFNLGESTRADHAQAQARLAKAKANLIKSQGEEEAAILRYIRLVGEEPDKEMPEPDLPILPSDVDSAISFAEKENAFLESFRRKYNAAKLRKRAASTVFMPSVYFDYSAFQAFGSNTNIAPKIGFSGSSSALSDGSRFSAGINFSLIRNVSTAWRVSASAAKANAKAFYELADKSAEIREKTAVAFSNFLFAAESFKAAETSVRAFSIALEGVKADYVLGGRNILDVLNAEQDLFTAESERIRASASRISSAYNLLAACGALRPDRIKSLGVFTNS